jgi:hypothetical protein
MGDDLRATAGVELRHKERRWLRTVLRRDGERLGGLRVGLPGQDQPEDFAWPFRSRSKRVTWDIRAKKEGAGFSLLATVTFPYSDFNIRKPNIAGFVTVDDTVTLQVQLVAQAT